MSDAAHQINGHTDQEYWRPPTHATELQEIRPQTDLCSRCSSEFVVGSRFCHVCGAERDYQPEYTGNSLTRYLDFRVITNALGLTVGSLVAFIIGIACVLAAVITGMIYTASTVLDWQAVQIWRIEWLLAALVAFTAGILLKRTA
ncbi:MAG TPA: hypothetical protein VD837_16405 [Terriglobales bacterium]|nr:hypothetical protein [Terriglobales bacterium]